MEEDILLVVAEEEMIRDCFEQDECDTTYFLNTFIINNFDISTTYFSSRFPSDLVVFDV